MQIFLDLSRVAPAFHEQHGLIPIDIALAESMIANSGTEIRVYGGQDGEEEPAFMALEVVE